MYDRLIRNVSLDGLGLVDIAIVAGRIVEIGAELAGRAREEEDCRRGRVLPGVVDAHVHFNEPGRTDWEGWETGSRAAAAGGVTTVLEMPLNAVPPTLDAESFALKQARAEAKSRVDFGLWGGLTPGNLDKLEELNACGVIGFKAFLSPSGTEEFVHADWETLRRGMKVLSGLGRRLAVHAEDPEYLKPCPEGGALAWEAARPVAAELSAVNRLAALAGETGCALHIVHVSHAEVVDCISAWRQRGVAITCETCPHYLHLSADDADRLGAVAKCAPPLRVSGQAALWERVSAGAVDTVGSDHSPCPPSMKAEAFAQAWGGISGVQHLLPGMMTPPPSCQKLSHERLTEVLCARPAALFGLGAQKGRLQPGYDADMVLVDDHCHVLHEKDLEYRHPHSAYVGKAFKTRVLKTWRRGHPIWPKPEEPAGGRLLRWSKGFYETAP